VPLLAVSMRQCPEGTAYGELNVMNRKKVVTKLKAEADF
jgi:CxxC motif-containing protein